jgi:hypothetical protein
MRAVRKIKCAGYEGEVARRDLQRRRMLFRRLPSALPHEHGELR